MALRINSESRDNSLKRFTLIRSKYALNAVVDGLLKQSLLLLKSADRLVGGH